MACFELHTGSSQYEVRTVCWLNNQERKRFVAMRPLEEDVYCLGSMPGTRAPAAQDRGLQHVIVILPSGGRAAMLVMCQHPVF